jgi:Tol biopolymer transport system component
LQVPRAVLRSPFIVVASALLGLGGLAHADHLADARLVTHGDFLAPQFSPDGRELLVTGSQLRGLQVVHLATGAIRELTDEAEAGVHARWTPDGRVHFRAPRAGTRRDLVVSADRTVTTFSPPPALAFAQDDRMYVVDRKGALARIGSGDRFFGAAVSPDGDKVVFQGLTTGLHLYIRSTGVLRYIGPGTAPAWSPDSTRIAYEVTEDDGHVIVASELYVYTLATDRAAPVTASDRVIERRPSFSPDGSQLAYDDNTGGIHVGRLEAR